MNQGIDKAVSPGICMMCGEPIYVGDLIYLASIQGNQVAIHHKEDCIGNFVIGSDGKKYNSDDKDIPG